MLLYRVETGYKHEPGTTAADVVRYEQQELGNDIEVTKHDLERLEVYPAQWLVWFCPLRSDAERYGEPDAYEVEGIIVGRDGDGGWLILTDTRETT